MLYWLLLIKDNNNKQRIVIKQEIIK